MQEWSPSLLDHMTQMPAWRVQWEGSINTTHMCIPMLDHAVVIIGVISNELQNPQLYTCSIEEGGHGLPDYTVCGCHTHYYSDVIILNLLGYT